VSRLGGSWSPDVEGVVDRQSGVVSRGQLLRLGVPLEAIRHRVKSGWLVAIHRGVYALGRAELSARGRIVAGLLAAGPTAVASHLTAAFLYELIATLPDPIEVTVLGRARRSRPTLTIHETTRPIHPHRRQGIPLTEPLRTLDDLAATQPRKEVERITQQALAQRLIRPDELPRGHDATRSDLENRMLALIRDAGLPEPLVNHRVGPYLVDFAWPEQRVIVETDGYATHGHRAAFERDRARDAALHAAGYVVLRFTYRQITRTPLTVIAALAGVLSPGSRAPARALA
jgi:very-short-patch-repair endonuclease